MLRRKLLITILTLVLLTTAQILYADDKSDATMQISIGDSKLVEVKGMIRVALGDPTLVDMVVVSQDELLLNGKNAGVTNLYIWTKGKRYSYQLEVAPKAQKLMEDLAKQLDNPNINAEFVGKTVILKGTVDNEKDSQRAEKIAAVYAEKVVNLLKVNNPGTTADRENTIQAITQAINYPAVKVNLVGKTVILEGFVDSDEEKTRIEGIAAAFTDKLTSFVDVRRPAQICIKVQILEVNKKAMEDFGVTWGGSEPNYSSSQSTTQTSSGTSSQSSLNATVSAFTEAGAIRFGQLQFDGKISQLQLFQAKIKALIETGNAKTLSTPSLIVKSGTKGNFLAGGEVPILISSSDDKTSSLQWREYGVRMDVEAALENSGNLLVKIKPEVSLIDWANSVKYASGTIPAFKTRRAETTLDLLDGQTLVIGGLIQNDESNYVTKLPLLGDIPILGQLFKSKEFINNETELVIFVTPTLVRSEQ